MAGPEPCNCDFAPHSNLMDWRKQDTLLRQIPLLNLGGVEETYYANRQHCHCRNKVLCASACLVFVSALVATNSSISALRIAAATAAAFLSRDTFKNGLGDQSMNTPVSVYQLGHTKVDGLGDDRPCFVFSQTVFGHNPFACLGEGVLHGAINRRIAVNPARIVGKVL